MNNILQRNLRFFVIFLSIGVPFLVAAAMMLTGGMPWWYDAAHNFVLAWDHLRKFTLIGPASGIPGIFYGPYWIWWMSLPMMISPNPRFVGLIVSTLPYFTLFPLLLFHFAKFCGRKVMLFVWLLFIMSVGIHYSTQLWSPNYAPLMMLWLVYLLFFTDRKKDELSTYFRVFLTGIVAALLMNVHLSFGMATMLGTGIYFLVEGLLELTKKKAKKRKVMIKNFLFVLCFGAGALLIFSPTLLFEYRHDFQQLHTLLTTFLKYGAVVSYKGLSNLEILATYFGKLGVLLHLPPAVGYVIEAFAVLSVYNIWKRKKLKLRDFEKKLLRILFSLNAGLFFLYLTARNPIWNYHFVGTEITFLLLIALVAHRSAVVRRFLTVWIIIVIMSFGVLVYQHFTRPKYSAPDLRTKEYITDRIAIDAKTDNYTVFTYSPAIYTYEYTYLFRWKYGKEIPYDPNQIPTGDRIVYVNIPKVSDNVREDYIHYRTPDEQYTTEKTWEIPDGSVVIKRVRK